MFKVAHHRVPFHVGRNPRWVWAAAPRCHEVECDNQSIQRSLTTIQLLCAVNDGSSLKNYRSISRSRNVCRIENHLLDQSKDFWVNVCCNNIGRRPELQDAEVTKDSPT
jgi:hypothetical protein